MSYPVQQESFCHRQGASYPAWLAFFLIFSLLALSGMAGAAYPGHYDQTLVIDLDGQRTVSLRVEVAADPESRQTGLMFRRYLPQNAGMLFDYRREQSVQMWMKNTLIPLDMLFIDARGRIVHIVANTEPGSLDIIDSVKPVRAVLEINAGRSDALGIRPGHRVSHPIFEN